MSLQKLPINRKDLEALIKKAKHYNIHPIFLPQYIPEIQDHPITNQLIE